MVPEGTQDVVISVLATRGDRKYTLPYHIKAANVGSISRDYLAARVMEDVDALVEQDKKREAVLAKLEGIVGREIPLD